MAASLQSLLQQDGAALQTALALESREARLEVQMLLQSVLQVSRAYLLAHPDRELDSAEAAAYQAQLKRRLAGEPMAHILGEREFFGLRLKVTPATLIPRPETELLVELALEKLSLRKGINILDLGTGTGAIALALAQARVDARVTAVDASAAALAVAKENARSLGLDRVSFQQSNWFDALQGFRFDLIVSNPPYIAEGDSHLAEGDVRFEPRSALVSGKDGLDDIRQIITSAHRFLERDAWLIFEHGYDQGPQVRALLEQNGYSEVVTSRDLAGNERVSAGRHAAER